MKKGVPQDAFDVSTTKTAVVATMNAVVLGLTVLRERARAILKTR